MSYSVTFWWKKYQKLRRLKAEFERKTKDIIENSSYYENAKNEYFKKIIEEIN